MLLRQEEIPLTLLSLLYNLSLTVFEMTSHSQPQSSKDLHQTLQKYQNFEELLLGISTHFIRLPAADVDGAIEDAQRRVCEMLSLDHSAVWQWSDKDPHIMTITHQYGPVDGPDAPSNIDASKTFPWVLQKVQSGEVLAFSTENMPEEANLDQETRRFYGVKSSVVMPLQEGGKPIMGAVSWDTLHEECSWSEQQVQRLTLVTEIFSNALARRQFEKEIIDSEARLALAAESAEAGIWEFDFISQTYWATDRALQIFGFPTGEVVSQEQVSQVIHSEDQEKFIQAMAESFTTGQKIDIECRTVLGSGASTWIYGKGQPFYNSDGSPSRMLGVCIDISERKKMEENCKKNLAEVEHLKKQLEQENYYLREDLRIEQGFENVIGESKEFKAVFTSARQVAATSATVLLLGETGTGKGIIAHAIQQMSDRCDKPFVVVNCAALPGNLIESELFGRERGAFTGAEARQVGRFEVANHGTIFLDEIGEMPIELQVKLLRVLQEGEFERLGSSKSIKVDVRVIAATSRNLLEDVGNGRFRQDLFYRLNVFPIVLPPLRQRRGDIPLLAQYFVEKYCRKMSKEIDSIPKISLEKMMNHSWPGNVRELEHEVERSVIISTGNTLALSDQCFCMTIPASSANASMKDLQSVERDHIREVLSQANWKIEGPGGAASILNIHPSTLRFRLKKLNIKRPS